MAELGSRLDDFRVPFSAGYIESWEHGIEPPVYDFGMAGLMLTFRANPAHL